MNMKNVPVCASSTILVLFTIFFMFKGNYEFLMYAITIGLLIYIIFKTDKMFNYSNLSKWGFVVWLFAHLSGGAFYFNNTRLYDIVFIPLLGEPFNILRYDQIMHILSYFVLTLFIYSMIISFAKKKPLLIAITALLAGMGLGAINEIIEFSTVVFFNSTGVGNYYNNALDLIFNFIGALIAVLFMSRNNKKTDIKKSRGK